ncbi:BTAD domain-containing putative transcriptional regulator [Gemmobacter serpentinus]|uniref:BTAD domain-containing putative transcriptional regulator n=1 Tax=Gemmobacter serpentinus TaxID=2652247 RepID=UPI00124E9AFD|nr:BTAD domain-containing putative transcriptional regulator [Gemmobacter serpentinus]
MANGYGYRVLDRFCLLHNGQEVAIRGQKQKAILAWFCLSGETGTQRDRLADLLWSHVGIDKARGSLRNTLHVLARESAPHDLLEAGRFDLRARFADAGCELTRDLAAWDAGDATALATRSLTDAEMRFAADLWGLDPHFDAFLTDRRATWLAQRAQALRDRLAVRDRLGVGLPSAEQRVLAERLREMLPQDEEATRALMRIDMAAGNTAAALDHYKRLWDVLDEEFDVEPSPATQELAVALKTGHPAAAAGAEAERITIFLQPFAFATLPDDEQILVSSVQAELSAALFAVEDWVTIETSPGMALPDAAGHYELRGTVSPGLEGMRLILSLKDLGSGTIIWTWPLHLHRDDWLRNSGFAVQRMAIRLTGKLEAHYISRIEGFSDSELADYRKLMRARWLMRDWSAEADRRAEAMLRAVRSGGELGIRARVGLSELLNSRELIFPGLGPMHSGVAEALEIGRACTEEAPERGDAWLAFGWSSILCDDVQMAARAASMVADLSQSNPRRLSAAAEMLALAGHLPRAVRLAEAASRLDAGVCRVSMGYRAPIALLRGDHLQAMDLAERAGGAIPFTYAYGAAAGQMAGDRVRGLRLWQLFCDDLARRWQGDTSPDPLAWFLAATSMRRGHGHERVAAALTDLTATHLTAPDPRDGAFPAALGLPAEPPVQRQERVV